MNNYTKSLPHQSEEHHERFCSLLDGICTDLYIGSSWHLRAANEMRKIAMRGFARMHEYGSSHDHSKRMELEKLLQDRLDYAPEIDVSEAKNAVSLTLKSPADIKPHLEHWLHNEKDFCKILNEAVRMASAVDMCVYKELACILEAVEEECMRIKFVQKRLELGGYSGHDLGVVSMIIHEALENNPGKGLDFNIG